MKRTHNGHGDKKHNDQKMREENPVFRRTEGIFPPIDRNISEKKSDRENNDAEKIHKKCFQYTSEKKKPEATRRPVMNTDEIIQGGGS